METSCKISIPKPCHEDWDKMTPDETGRFCSSCAKSVVDFTGMKTGEIQQYFIQHRGQKTCGRFKADQLDSIIIQIPQEVLFKQVQFHKIFMLALLISMGTTLFSCQSETGKKKIDGVEIVNDSTEMKPTLGLPLPPKQTECDTLDKEQKTVRKVGYPTVTGETIVLPEPQPQQPTIDTNKIYPASTVEVKPEFPGGLSKFYEYVLPNFKVSEENKKITGRIIMTFLVDTDGSLQDVKVVRGINESMDAEAMRVLKSSPKWIPGEQNGEKVKVSYSLPIKITAQE